MMNVGYSITSAYSLTDRPADIATGILERARLAEAAGFDYVQCGDHHVQRDAHYVQNIPTIARLSGVFDHVACMVLLPLYNPVLVAEQIGTIGAFADRVDFWCAIGYGREAFDAFGVPFAERVPRFLEAVELVRELWTQETVTSSGEFYPVTDAGINPKTNPRIVVGGGVESAVRRAGEVGDAWVAGPRETLESLQEKIDWYTDAGGQTVIVRRDILALEDGPRARELAAEQVNAGYRGWSSDTDTYIAGDAADVATAFRELEAIGVDEVVTRPMTIDHAKDTIETVAASRR